MYYYLVPFLINQSLDTAFIGVYWQVLQYFKKTSGLLPRTHGYVYVAFDSINYKNGHPKSRFVGSNYKKPRQRVECMQ